MLHIAVMPEHGYEVVMIPFMQVIKLAFVFGKSPIPKKKRARMRPEHMSYGAPLGVFEHVSLGMTFLNNYEVTDVKAVHRTCDTREKIIFTLVRSPGGEPDSPLAKMLVTLLEEIYSEAHLWDNRVPDDMKDECSGRSIRCTDNLTIECRNLSHARNPLVRVDCSRFVLVQ